MTKIKVGILFGGRSAEHEISLQSAKNVIEALDKAKYDATLIGIDKEGKWHSFQDSAFLLNETNPKLIKLNQSSQTEVAVALGTSERPLVPVSSKKPHSMMQEPMGVDVIFPVLHGTFGEDGTVQGLLKLAGIPFVGADVLGSAVGMDKDVMKRLLRDAGLPIADFLTFRRFERSEISYDKVKERLGEPFFIKPANLGSSVGISKVSDKSTFEKGIETAFFYDNKIVIEENITGREIEVGVLGNEHPIASIPGEVIPHHDFYSYEAKYIDADGAGLKIPAEISDAVAAELKMMAVKVFKTLECEGLGRVDFFLVDGKKILVNEINTIPGFTKISMYPRLWQASGIPYAELIDRLLQLAIEKHERDSRLRSSV